jgi:Sulfotransferase family
MPPLMISPTDRFQTESPDSGVTYNQSSRPLFVVGMWRSGTSLLYALLNQHPEIGLMYEDDLALLWPMFIGGKARRDWLARWNFWNSAPQRHKIDLSRIPAAVPSLKAALEFAYKSGGVAIWGAKSPNYYDSMMRLTRIFPNARFIVIWRNLGGICSSITRAGQQPSWFARAGITHRTILGYHRMKVECERLLGAGIEVHQIHYEELVADPAGTMRGICQFLQIPFDPRMSSLRNADRSAVFDHGHHALVNSSEIVSSRERLDVLSSRVKRKIARYTCLWRDDYRGQWPVYAAANMSDQNQPSWIERGVDRLIYHLLRTYDLGVIFVYCFAPMFLLRGYRASKRRTAAAVTRQVQAAPDSETESTIS